MLTKRRFLLNAGAINDRGYRAVEIFSGERSSAGFLTENAKMAPVPAVNAGVKHEKVLAAIKSCGFEVTAFQMFFFALFAFAAALAFGFVARRYPVADHYRRG